MLGSLLWIAGALSGVLLAFTALAATVGIVGMLTGGRIERCSRCRRYGFAVGSSLHAAGCPATAEHRLHLRHH